MKPFKGVLASLVTYGLLLSFLLIVVYPMLWLFYSSLKEDREIFLNPFSLPRLDDLQWRNYTNAWTTAHFGRYFFNSVVVTGISIALLLLLASMSAYALARFRFPGSTALLFFFLSGLMIPTQLSIVPLFFQMRTLNLLNSLPGLVLVYVAGGLPFAIFVLTGFFKTIPRALYESACIDGAGELRAFWSVMLPLSRPGLITVAIFSFLGIWNEFFLAFMFLSGKGAERIRTLPLGLANVTMLSQYRSDWGTVFAALVLLAIPTLAVYALLQKHLTRGITMGAIKG